MVACQKFVSGQKKMCLTNIGRIETERWNLSSEILVLVV